MSDIIIPWSGTHAGIPAGWTRYTALDNKFPKASGAESATTTGGATTHTHTSASHTHTIGAHTHTYTTGDSGGGTGSTANASDGVNKSHTHSGTSGAASGGTTDGTAATYGASNNTPPYLELIFIKAALTTIPVDGLIMWDQVSAPSDSDYKVTDGTLSTVDLDDTYMKSAGTTGNSGTTGGSTTNIHSLSHTHTTNTHTHSGAATGGASALGGDIGPSAGVNSEAHTHTASFGSTDMSINTFADNLVTGETVEPAYHTLMAYQNKGGGALAIPLNTIAMTIESTLPSGWVLCDGTNSTQNLTDKFVKISTNSGNIGNTGGSNTHTHASQDHTHTTTGTHTHTVDTDSDTGDKINVGSGAQNVAQTHSHTQSTSAGTAGAYAAGSTSADSSANQPEYVIVKYIQKQTEITAGASFLMLFV